MGLRNLRASCGRLALALVPLPLLPPSESESSLPMLPSPLFIVATRAFCCFRDMREVSMMRRGEEGEGEAFLPLLSSSLPLPPLPLLPLLPLLLLLVFLFEAAATATRADLGGAARR